MTSLEDSKLCFAHLDNAVCLSNYDSVLVSTKSSDASERRCSAEARACFPSRSQSSAMNAARIMQFLESRRKPGGRHVAVVCVRLNGSVVRYTICLLPQSRQLLFETTTEPRAEAASVSWGWHCRDLTRYCLQDWRVIGRCDRSHAQLRRLVLRYAWCDRSFQLSY